MAINVVEILVKAKDMTEAGFAEAEAQTTTFGSRVKAMGTVAAGALAVIGYESAKMAINFNSAMEQLVTQAGVSNAKLAVLKQGVLQLAAQVGESPDSLAESLYHVASNMQSLGATAPQMLSVVKIAAEGAKVGGADLVDVTNALTAAIASGIPGVQNYSQAMGALNAIVGSGDMKMQDLAEAFGSGMVATVKGFGLSLTDVGAALAVFGDNNIRGAHAGTQLRMSVMALAAPVATAAPLLAQLGMNTQTLANTMQHGGLLPALELLKTRMRDAGITAKEQGNEITQIFGKKAGAGLNVLLDQMDRVKSKYPDITKGARDFGTAWGDTQKQVKQQLSQLGAGFDALMVTLGEKLIPVIQRVVTWMLAHKQVVTDLAIALGGLAVVAAVVAGAVALISSPITLIVAGIAALVAGIVYAYKHFAVFREVVASVASFFVGVWNGAVKAAGAVVAWFVNGPLAWIRQQLAVVTAFWSAHSQEILTVAKFVWREISLVIGVAWAVIQGVFKTGSAVISGIWNTAWAVISGTVRTVWDFISGVVHTGLQFVLNAIGVVLDLITGHWSKAWHDLITLASDAFHGVISIITSLASNFGSLLFNAGKALVGGLINGIKSMFGAIGSTVSSVASKVAGFFGLSPAVEGPLSGGGAPEVRGRHFAEALAGGVRAGIPGAGSAAGALAGALVPRGGMAAGAGAGAGGPLRLQLEWVGGQADSEFMTWLARNIRVKGGDPRILTQKVSALT